jgi:chromosome partitioning protein
MVLTASRTTDTPVRLSDPWVVAVPNQKGGVGKTTICLALAAVTAEANGRALVVDVDPQSTASEQADRMEDPGFDHTHELEPRRLRALGRIRDYDMIFVDCPGSLEGQGILDEVLHNSHFAVIPYEAAPEALRPTIRTAHYVRDRGVHYKVLLTKFDARRGVDEVRDAWAAMERARVPRFRCFVRHYTAYPNALREGLTITQYRGGSAANARDDARRVHTELLLELGRIAAISGS